MNIATFKQIVENFSVFFSILSVGLYTITVKKKYKTKQISEVMTVL